jgi:hypothetical protein
VYCGHVTTTNKVRLSTSPILQQAYGCKSLLVTSHTTPQRRRNLVAVSFHPTPTQQSLAYDAVEHPPVGGLRSSVRLLPPPDGVCPTVHHSTAKSSLVNPKRSTSPRQLPGQLCVRGVACYVALMLVPLADGACSTVHHSTANSGIANPDSCTLARRRVSVNGKLYVGVTQSCRTLSRKVTVGFRWRAVTPLQHND